MTNKCATFYCTYDSVGGGEVLCDMHVKDRSKLSKPHITKVGESPWWSCNGALGSSPGEAFAAWERTRGRML